VRGAPSPPTWFAQYLTQFSTMKILRKENQVAPERSQGTLKMLLKEAPPPKSPGRRGRKIVPSRKVVRFVAVNDPNGIYFKIPPIKTCMGEARFDQRGDDRGSRSELHVGAGGTKYSRRLGRNKWWEKKQRFNVLIYVQVIREVLRILRKKETH